MSGDRQQDEKDFLLQLYGTPRKEPNPLFRKLVKDQMRTGCDFDEALDRAIDAYAERGLEVFEQKDSGNSFAINDPVTKALLKGERGDILLGTSDTGEAAVFSIIDGFITPYEKDIAESISKFKLDGQVTERGKVYCTLGQLYRAMRHGAGTQSPTQSQKEALLAAVKAMAQEDRKIAFELSDYLKIWGGFETDGGRLRIVSFDEFKGRIRGQKDWLLVFDETPIICAISERLRMGEIIPQSVKAIQQQRFYLEYKKPTKSGRPTTRRSFSSNEERKTFCKRNGLTNADIVSYGEELQPYALSEQRIAIRQTIFTFVFSYLRARTVGKPHSNKLPFSAIWERCGCNVGTRQQLKQNKEIVAVICEHLKREGVITAWSEYKNTGSKKPDGVQFSIAKAITEGAT